VWLNATFFRGSESLIELVGKGEFDPPTQQVGKSACLPRDFLMNPPVSSFPGTQVTWSKLQSFFFLFFFFFLFLFFNACVCPAHVLRASDRRVLLD